MAGRLITTKVMERNKKRGAEANLCAIVKNYFTSSIRLISANLGVITR